MNLYESIQRNLNEDLSITLPKETQEFGSGEVGENYNSSESACKLNAFKAYMNDNAEDIYAGSVKVDGVEITHFFNVKDGKVIDHSATAQNHEMTDYKGVNITQELANKGFFILKDKMAFQNDNGDIIEIGNLGNRLWFKLNGQEISYDDISNL